MATSVRLRWCVDDPFFVGSDARLVLLHIVRKPEPGDVSAPAPSRLDDARPPRWSQLAAAAHPGRVFVEAMQGDPARIIPGEAERFHSDTIRLDRPVVATARAMPLPPPPHGAVC